MNRISAAFMGLCLLLLQTPALFAQNKKQPYLLSYSYDVTSPELRGVPRDTVLCATYPPAPKVTAVDDVDGPLGNVVYSEELSEGPFLNSELILRQWSATDASGNTAEAYQFIVVRKPFSVLAITAPQEALSVDTEVSMLAAIEHGGTLNEGARANIKWTWFWGDGTRSEGYFTDHQVTGSHTYQQAGTYAVSLKYEDVCGNAIYTHQSSLSIGASSQAEHKAALQD